MTTPSAGQLPPPVIGSRWTLNADAEPVKAKRRTTFLPGYSYAVTPLNQELVAGLIAEGKATLGGAPSPFAAKASAARSDVAGRMTTGKKPKKR